METKANIHFDSYYESIKQSYIYNKINNYSESIVRCEFRTQNVLELIKVHFGELETSYNENYDFIKAENKIKQTFSKLYMYNNKGQIAFMIDGGDEYYAHKIDDEDEDIIETEEGETYNIDELIPADEDAAELLNILNDDKIASRLDITNTITIYYDIEIKNKVDNFINDLNKIIEQIKQENLFYTIGIARDGFTLNKQRVDLTKKINIPLHYGKDFVPVYNEIIENLTNKSHGLFLLYGVPGTGKTMIIRQLINEMCDKKKVIYVPTYMIDNIANPEFISFLQKHKDIILILEDAEYTLQKREEKYGAQGVSNLLNLTNGLLNDSIKVQIVATFNMDKQNIDPALLRPGRLLNEWEFNKLSVEDSKELAKFIQSDIDIDEPMTVSEIYNGLNDTKLKKKEPNKIGF